MMIFVYLSGGPSCSLYAFDIAISQPTIAPRHSHLQCPYLTTLPGLFKQINKLNNNPYKLSTDKQINLTTILINFQQITEFIG